MGNDVENRKSEKVRLFLQAGLFNFLKRWRSIILRTFVTLFAVITITAVIVAFAMAAAMIIAYRGCRACRQPKILLIAMLAEDTAHVRAEGFRRTARAESALELLQRLLGLVPEESGGEMRRQNRGIVRERPLQFLHVVSPVPEGEIFIELETTRRGGGCGSGRSGRGCTGAG